jgi:hypothetical protein
MHMAVSLRSKGVLHISVTALLVALAVLSAVRTTAGIQGSGLNVFAAIGPISAVGSGTVTVGGVDYSTTGAQVEVDGHTGTAQQLRTGEIVSVRGTIAQGPQGRTAIASAVAFSGNVRGAVSGVDTTSGMFFVLGQTVQVTADTVFGARIRASGLQGLQSGAVVEVSGFADSAGNIVASRVSSVGSSTAARVTGTVQNLDPQQKTFNIRSLSVSYAGAVVRGTLADGIAVTVQGPQPAANGPLEARQVRVSPALQAPPGAEGRIEGLITDFASANYFEVDGQAVIVDSQTRLALHVPLGLNVAVRVSGVFDENGALVARHLQASPAPR